MSIRRILFHIVLKAQPSKPAFFLAVMQAIQAAMAAHASTFVAPPVDLNTFKSQNDALAVQQQAARARVPGAAALRDEALRVVAASAELLRAYVEQLCNASPEQGITIAQSASMHITARAVRPKVPLRARQGAQPGVVILYASVALLVTGKGGRYFNWSYSIDGGTTWIPVTSTPKSKTTISGLPVLKECLFRASVTDNHTGQGPWCPALPFLVH
jgi:hypothetical protein